MGMSATCRFCPELAGELNSSTYHQLAGTGRTRFIRESSNFVIFPTLGPLVPGHLLIVPKQHFLSTGHLPLALFDELESVVGLTLSKLQMVYGCTPILFEHGPLSISEKGGCCVDHAHIHVVPAAVDIRPHSRKLYAEQVIMKLVELRTVVEAGSPYLFFQNTTGERFVYEAPVVISQFLRIVTAHELGTSNSWDWRSQPRIDAIEETLVSLADWSNVAGDLDWSSAIASSSSACELDVFT